MSGSWEQLSRPSIICGILHVDTTTVRWAFGLRNLIFPGPHHIMAVAGMPFDHARNAVAAQVQQSQDVDYLFFLDSDVVPPPDAIIRLLRHRKPIISGVYCRRSPPHGVPVMQRGGQWVTDLPQEGRDPLIEVDVVGAGCLLIHRSVLQLPPQRPGKPWFDWKVDMQGHLPPEQCMSEDFSWCKHVRDHGHKIMVDTSVRCLHIGHCQADFGSLVPLVT